MAASQERAGRALQRDGKANDLASPATAKDVKRAAKRAKAAARAAERADKAAHAKAAKTSKSKATRESAAGSGTLPAGDEENEGAVRVRLRVASLGVAVVDEEPCEILYLSVQQAELDQRTSAVAPPRGAQRSTGTVPVPLTPLPQPPPSVAGGGAPLSRPPIPLRKARAAPPTSRSARRLLPRRARRRRRSAASR